MTFYLLYPAALKKCHHLFGFRRVLGAIIEGCGDALWSVLHTALIILCFFIKRLCFPPVVLLLICCSISLCLSLSPGDMLDLLKWRAHPERINDSLSKLKEIDGSEIVKVGPDSQLRIAPTIPAFGLLIVFWFDFFKFTSHIKNLFFPVSTGHPGHSFWYSGWKLSEIWTQGVRFTGKWRYDDFHGWISFFCFLLLLVHQAESHRVWVRQQKPSETDLVV